MRYAGRVALRTSSSHTRPCWVWPRDDVSLVPLARDMRPSPRPPARSELVRVALTDLLPNSAKVLARRADGIATEPGSCGAGRIGRVALCYPGLPGSLPEGCAACGAPQWPPRTPWLPSF